MATTVDPNRLIQALTAQVGQLTLQNTALTIALEDANAVISKHGMAESPESGQGAD